MTPDSWSDFLISAGLRSLLVASAAMLIYRAVRHRSNRLRFSVVLGSMVALGLLPVALAAFPKIEWGLIQAAGPGTTDSAIRIGNLLAVIWVFGLALGVGRLASAYLALNRLQRRARVFESSQPTHLLAQLQERVGWNGTVRLLTSTEISRPVVCGLWRPTILLPPSASGWSQDRLERVLAHELAHVVRRDLWSQWWCQVVSAFYWFNPLVRKLSTCQILEREIAADELALAITGDNRAGYARELLAIATEPADTVFYRPLPAAAAAMLGATSRLEERIANLFRKGPEKSGRRKAFAPILAFILGALVFVGCSACDPFASGKGPWTEKEVHLRLSADPFPAD